MEKKTERILGVGLILVIIAVMAYSLLSNDAGVEDVEESVMEDTQPAQEIPEPIVPVKEPVGILSDVKCTDDGLEGTVTNILEKDVEVNSLRVVFNGKVVHQQVGALPEPMLRSVVDQFLSVVSENVVNEN